MKKLMYIIFLLFAGSSVGWTQTPPPLSAFELQIFDPLPSISFANLVVSNGLSATQPVFKVIMSNGTPLRLEGIMYWKDINSNNFVELAYFLTKPFASRSILSNQLGTGDLRVESDRINQTAIDQNLAKGRPIGTYAIEMRVLTPDMNTIPGFSNIIRRELTFYNPSQTITITSPQPGATENPTDVIVNWTTVIGAQYYIVKVNNRKTPSQNLEAILTSENPLVNNKNVGNVSSVSLRSILEREWTGGDEIVVRVSAYIPGPSGGFTLESQIINFMLAAPNNVQTQQQNNALQTLLAYLPPNLLAQYNNLLASSQLSITGFQNADGSFLTQAQVTAILQALQADPSRVVSLIINPNTGGN